MAFVYNVFVNETDPDDLDHYEYVGYRATMRGAQSLAEKYLKRQIHGFFKRAHNTWFTGAESWTGKQAKIVYDYPWGKPNQAAPKRDPQKQPARQSKTASIHREREWRRPCDSHPRPDWIYALELWRPATNRWERMAAYLTNKEAMEELKYTQERLKGKWRVKRERYHPFPSRS